MKQRAGIQASLDIEPDCIGILLRFGAGAGDPFYLAGIQNRTCFE
jgi:hypothetical protein